MEEETQENQSYNYPDFLCHFKRRRTQCLTIVLVWGRVSVTVFYQHKLCFNSEYSAVNPFGWQSFFQRQKCEGERKKRERRSVWHREISGRAELRKLKSCFQTWNSRKSYTAPYGMVCLVVECAVCVCVCILTGSDQNRVNNTKPFPWSSNKHIQ